MICKRLAQIPKLAFTFLVFATTIGEVFATTIGEVFATTIRVFQGLHDYDFMIHLRQFLIIVIDFYIHSQQFRPQQMSS